MENTCAIIMAAGDGKRTKSSRPKALSKILFTPILQWIIAAVKAAGVEDICVVAGSKHEAVEEFLARYDDSVEIVRQEQRLGTSPCGKTGLGNDRKACRRKCSHSERRLPPH